MSYISVWPWSPAILKRPVPQTPQAILGAKLVGFLDAEDNTKITQAGGLVSALADTISATSFSQATGSLKPVVATNSVTGRQVIRFDGVDDFLEFAGIPAAWPTAAAAGDMIYVGSQDFTVAQDATAKTLAAYGAAGNTGTRRMIRGATGNFIFGVGDGVTALTDNHPSTGFLRNHFVRGSCTGTTILAEMDGSITSGTACVPATTSVRTRVGCNTANTPGTFHKGDLSALLITNAVPTAAEMEALRLSLCNRLFG